MMRCVHALSRCRTRQRHDPRPSKVAGVGRLTGLGVVHVTVAMVVALIMAPISTHPAAAQELLTFTPSSSAGTLYIGSPTGSGAEATGVSIGVRMTDMVLNGGDPALVGAADGTGPGTMVTGGAIVDVYPFSSGLRLSGGLRFGDTGGDRFDAQGAVTVGGATYPAMLVTSPDGVEVDGPTPYVGVGYGTTLFDGTIDLSIDAGALTAVPGSSGLSVNDGPGGIDADVGDFLPMVGVSATYRF